MLCEKQQHLIFPVNGNAVIVPGNHARTSACAAATDMNPLRQRLCSNQQKKGNSRNTPRPRAGPHSSGQTTSRLMKNLSQPSEKLAGFFFI